MKKTYFRLLLFLFTFSLYAQGPKVSVMKDAKGMKLMIDGKPTMINGINWDYVPIGYNVLDAKFWEKPDAIIKAVNNERADVKDVARRPTPALRPTAPAGGYSTGSLNNSFSTRRDVRNLFLRKKT